MISSHYGQFGYWGGLGDIGDLGAAKKKRRRGKRSFRRQSQRQQRQQEEQQQSQDSSSGGDSYYDEGYDEEEGSTESALSAEQLQALAQLMQGKKKHRRRRRRKSSMSGVWGFFEGLGDAVTFGAFGRGGGGGRGRGSRSYHYHLSQLAAQAQQQQQQQSSSDPSSSGGGSSSSTDLEALLDKLLEKRGISGVFGDVLDGVLGVFGEAFGAVWGTAARLAGWAGFDLGEPFGLFSALRPSQSSAWALPSPYAGVYGDSEVEAAAREQRRRGLAAFLHNAFAEMGGGDPRVGQRRLAEASTNYGPDAVIAIQEYLAARGQSPAALQRRLRVLRLEYGRARQQGNMAEANRLYYRINAIESRLARLGWRGAATAGPGGPMDTRVGLSIDSDVSVGTRGIPWKPILVGVGVITLVSVVAGKNKRGGRKPEAA